MDPTTGGSFSLSTQRRGSAPRGFGCSTGAGVDVVEQLDRMQQTRATRGIFDMELWLDVVGFEGLYRVSNLGRVSGPTRTILKPFINPRGYPQVGLHREGRRAKTVFIHRLVAEAFLGPCPDGMECLHRDGDHGNVRLSNLKWGTHSENALDAFRHGASPQGVDHFCAKLTPEAAADIRQNYRCYSRQSGGVAFARKYGVTPQTVHAVVKGITWKGEAPAQ